MVSKDTVISLVNVHKSFGRQVILKNISLDIPAGNIFGIVGSSGSGKSTLLKIITGSLLPDKGDILFEPKDLAGYSLLDPHAHLQSIHKNISALKRTVGYSPQDPSFYDKLSCIENIDFFGSLYRLPVEILKINSKILLKLVGLEKWSHKKAGDLSGGMQKRLDLACSLVHDPKILVLDEPTSDLDVVLREQMWELIRKIKQKGTTVIMSSHFIDEIEGLCDKIIVLNKSQIEFFGSPEDLKKRKDSGIIIKLKTVEKDYGKISRALSRHYPKSNIDFTYKKNSGDFIIMLKNIENYDQEISTVSNIVMSTNQHILDFNFSKEGISEFFQNLSSEEKFFDEKHVLQSKIASQKSFWSIFRRNKSKNKNKHKKNNSKQKQKSSQTKSDETDSNKPTSNKSKTDTYFPSKKSSGKKIERPPKKK